MAFQLMIRLTSLNFMAGNLPLNIPSVDDIVQDILAIDDPVIFKVDVARAFCNLRVDPVRAIKFSISWKYQFYINLIFAFGWIPR